MINTKKTIAVILAYSLYGTQTVMANENSVVTIQDGADILSLETAPKGVLVTKSSPSSRWALREDDVIRSIEGTVVKTPQTYIKVVCSAKKNDVLHVVVLRSGKTETSVISPSSYPCTMPPIPPTPPTP